MRKRSFLAVAVLSLIFLGCKSMPSGTGRKVRAAELLDNSSGFYIAIPKSADADLIERIIKNSVTGISDSDVRLISGRIDKIYCGLNRRKNHVDIQAAIDASVPVRMIPRILSVRNGWDRHAYVAGSSNQYDVYSYDSLEMAFPSAEICCIGRGMPFMLEKFDAISRLPSDDSTALHEIPGNLFDYLEGAADEIRFYALTPQSFLTILTGTQLNLNLVEVRGCFAQDPKFQSQYILNLNFAFKNETMLKAGRAILMLAFGLTNSQGIEERGNELAIKGIKLDKNQLYKLLAL